jgi:hypothetical protein
MALRGTQSLERVQICFRDIQYQRLSKAVGIPTVQMGFRVHCGQSWGVNMQETNPLNHNLSAFVGGGLP